ncbi:LAMI_0G01728g1_1 [Lachancea mirantina]|uniref:LAMI_0G01728g1_1 n=1 Tax=Lachancea mirantina TaxID=1230905 RepID=A0A1G4K7J4_9SACH|nr:LAMI_0G01728g1_1 [Lachancea mirantina]
MADDKSYRMLVLLEDALPNAGGSKDETKNDAKATHEFVDELILPFDVDALEELNEWFDAFDAAICIPNEGFIKYEISSDGLVVLLLDRSREKVVDEVRKFVETHA